MLGDPLETTQHVTGLACFRRRMGGWFLLRGATEGFLLVLFQRAEVLKQQIGQAGGDRHPLGHCVRNEQKPPGLPSQQSEQRFLPLRRSEIGFHDDAVAEIKCAGALAMAEHQRAGLLVELQRLDHVQQVHFFNATAHADPV